MGLTLVLNTAMIGDRSAARGSPERKKAEMSYLNANKVHEGEEKRGDTFKKHCKPLSPRIPG